MVWNESIRVSLTISGALRIGSGRAGLEVDLPVVRENLSNGGSTFYSSNMPSSFRGSLRESVRRMINSTRLSSKASLEESLFGTWVTEAEARPMEGKLHVKLLPSNEPIRTTSRTGVEIDDVFGSVEQKKLFTYEVMEGGGDEVTLRFELTCLFPLSDEEAAVLLAGLNGLVYESIGGFASRGMGLIERVEVDGKFRDYAYPHLTKILSQEG